MTPRTIVIDPGHGGTVANGGSSPNNATGPNGLLEKNLALDIAQRVARRLRADKSLSVILTRDTDVNPSLKQRAHTARDANADLFLSIHFNGDTDARIDGTETWVARAASAESRDFATVVLRHLVGATGVRDRGVREANFGVLLPTRHAANTAACLAEVAFLTNDAQARRLEQDTYRDEIAAALCAGVREALAAMPAAVAHGMGDKDTTPAWAATPYGAVPHNGNGNGNGNGTRPVRMFGAYDRRGSLLFALDDPKDKVAPPPPPPPAPVTDPQRLVWSSKAVLRNGGPDFKAITPKKTIPQFSIVTVTAFDGNFAQVKDAGGTALGWTKKDNLRLLFKDRSALTSITTLTPATAITVKAGWSDEKKDIAEVYNRIGAVVEGCSKASGADVAAILAVWLVESGGGPKPAKMDIRIELHVLFDEWGISNQKDFDDHFQFGTRKPFTGPKCAARTSCHRYRDDEKKDSWVYPHSSSAEEYKLLTVAERVAGDVVYRCMSMGGAQVMGFHHDKLGYATAKLMFDAFDKSEAAQLFGLLDEGQDTGALKHLVSKNFKKFARVYNGSGKVTEYSTKMKKAFDAAVAILPSAPTVAPSAPAKTTPPAPAPAKTKSLGTDEATETQSNVFTEALDNRKKPATPDVTWAADADSIDYSHLGIALDTRPFELTFAHLESLASLNSFDLASAENLVLFALRGCSLVEGDETEWVDKVQLKEAVPDHEHDRCVVGMWKRDAKKLRAFTGSTVPVKKAVKDQLAKKQKANLLPTGLYRYHNGDHNSGKLLISDAFRQEGQVVVLRSYDDLTYTTRDTWDPGYPADNIHATRHLDDTFSSYGCVTVKGTYDLPPTNTHHGPWATFRTSAGLRADSKDAEDSKKFHLMLLTGREAHCVVLLKDPSSLRRLRYGSSGDNVKALQTALKTAGFYNDTADSDMGPGTVKALIDWQRAQNPSRPSADGIFSPAHATTIGVTFAYDEEPADEDEESEAQELVSALDQSPWRFEKCPLIDPPSDLFRAGNLGMRWSDKPAKGAPVNVLVHLHGFHRHTKPDPTFEFDRLCRDSGADFPTPPGGWPAWRRPTLAIVPAGHRTGGVTDANMDVYDFPEVLKDKGKALNEIIKWSQERLATVLYGTGAPIHERKRLIMTAHSGGGARLMSLLKSGAQDPDELHLFDAFYDSADEAIKWATRHIPDDVVMLKPEPVDKWDMCMATRGHALRSVFLAQLSMSHFNCELQEGLERELKKVKDDATRNLLRKYYRVEQAEPSPSLDHLKLPPTFGGQIVANAGADLTPKVTRPSARFCASAHAAYVKEQEEKARKKEAAEKKKAEEAAKKAPATTKAFSIW